MPDEKYNYDFEDRMLRPAAWRKMKEAFGAKDIAARLMFRRFEKIANGKTARIHFFAALYAYTRLGEPDRHKAIAGSMRWDSIILGNAGGRHESPPREAPQLESDVADDADSHKLAQVISNDIEVWKAPKSEECGYGPWYFVCTHCRRRYWRTHALHAHLLKVHGVTASATLDRIDVHGVTYAVRRITSLHVYSETGQQSQILVDHTAREFVIGAIVTETKLPALLAEAVTGARSRVTPTPPDAAPVADDDTDDEGEEGQVAA